MSAVPLNRSALRLLGSLTAGRRDIASVSSTDADALVRSDLARATSDGRLQLTEAGRFFLARHASAQNRDGSAVDAFRAQHLSLVDAPSIGGAAAAGVKFDESESPLVWLARRKGVDGRALIEPHQLQAGERLRAEFTAAQMMPRTTANWDSPVDRRQRGRHAEPVAERVIAARQRLRHALDAAGPEFSGLLVDVCCFLKKLDDVERERRWPARSAKVVLQLALERLARHFGYQGETQGKAGMAIRTWAAKPETESVEG